jgi:hypothetical protein
MNLAKHFISPKKGEYIGTFVSDVSTEGPRFGWAKYSYFKEKSNGISFNKKTGTHCALESIAKDIVIDTATNHLIKGDIKIRDPEMVKAAMDFVTRMKKYYKKTPINVKVILTIDYLKDIVQDALDQNDELKKTILMLKTKSDKLTSENNSLKSKIKNISQVCLD